MNACEERECSMTPSPFILFYILYVARLCDELDDISACDIVILAFSGGIRKKSEGSSTSFKIILGGAQLDHPCFRHYSLYLASSHNKPSYSYREHTLI